MSWQVLRLHRGKVEEPFAHTCLTLLTNTRFEPSHAAHPQCCATEPLPLALPGQEPHSQGNSLLLVWPHLPAQSQHCSNIHGRRRVQGVPDRDISEDIPADPLCKGPLLQLHWFCSCKSVSCKQTFARSTCTVHSVCCIQESVILCLQPARNTSTKTPLPEITPRHSANGSGLHWSSWHSSGTEAGAACEETTLQLHFIQADTHHLQPLQVTLFL